MNETKTVYFPRTLEASLLKLSRQFPVLLVSGPRQVGKTTFLRHLAKNNRTYVTLDDPLVLSLAKADPALFLQRYPPPLLIDEIQYAPELLPHIKMAVDNGHQAGQFWLTGSQQFHLMKGVSESLAGRVGIVQLQGFSRLEGMGKGKECRPFLPTKGGIEAGLKRGGVLGLKELYKLIWRGSFPALAKKKSPDRNVFYNSYVQTYLQRDVRDLAKVGDEMAFLRFMRAAAARTGQLLNLAELAKDTGVSPPTAKNWLSILETSGIIYQLEPYFNNVTKRLIKTPKLYFLDTGLATFLTEWSGPETLEAGAMSGHILETWVVSELLKSYWHAGKRAPFYYYRDKDQKEIDLLIIQDGNVYPLEIKKSASPKKEDTRHFQVLGNLGIAIGPGGVLCLANHYLPLTDSESVIPVALI
jgi:uncharacterized protein